MRKILLYVFIFSCIIPVLAQTGNVGIGTATPDGTSKLDVTAADKGILTTRVALTSIISTSPIKNAAGAAASTTDMPEGLLVYNTATAGTGSNIVTPGYYYWDKLNNKWHAIKRNIKYVSDQTNSNCVGASWCNHAGSTTALNDLGPGVWMITISAEILTQQTWAEFRLKEDGNVIIDHTGTGYGSSAFYGYEDVYHAFSQTIVYDFGTDDDNDLLWEFYGNWDISYRNRTIVAVPLD